jgi:type 1 glutamine amidotransferase
VRWLLACVGAAVVVGAVVSVAAQAAPPLRIFLRAGPKTHGPAGNGLHDGPTWLREWRPLLASRGAVVDGALRFPTAAELDRTDVLVMFAADAGTILGEDRANLEHFLARGGGIVCFHDAVVAASDSDWFKTIVGGAWENGVARYFEGENTYYYVNTAHPITQGAVTFTIEDEVYWNLHMMPGANILAVSFRPQRPGRGAAPDDTADRTLIPQMWTYENRVNDGQPYRAFVSLLGHHIETFASPRVRAILLRGIAWAGKRNVDSLTTAEEVAGLSGS